jgi:hypothetical protein
VQDGEPNVYAGLATLRNGYSQSQWQRVGMFLVLNAAAFPIVFGSDQTGNLKLVICVIADMAHMAILAGSLRADMWIQEIDQRLAKLETLDREGENKLRIAFFSDPAFARKRKSILASRRVFLLFWFITFLLWAYETYTRTLPYLSQL